MSSYNWEEIQLYRTAVDGLIAIEKLTGEKPAIGMVITEKKARDKWNATNKMVEDFYKLDIQERLYASGINKRPEPASNGRELQ